MGLKELSNIKLCANYVFGELTPPKKTPKKQQQQQQNQQKKTPKNPQTHQKNQQTPPQKNTKQTTDKTKASTTPNKINNKTEHDCLYMYIPEITFMNCNSLRFITVW